MGRLKAVVNLNALYNNLQIIKSKTSAEIYAVVKANAYGHGMCAATFLQPYVDGFCVAGFEEAAHLVSLAIYKPVIVLKEVTSYSDILPYDNIVYSVGSESAASLIKRVNPSAPFYVKINTGMNRLGCKPTELPKIMSYVRHNSLNCLGMCTHFYDSDNYESTAKQFEEFNSAVAECGESSFEKHCCASNALYLPKSYHGDIIRVGLALYGYGKDDGLIPAMSLYAPIVKIRDISKGEQVGYGDYKADRNCRMAVLQIGYGDGYRRIASGTRYVCVNGKRCPLLGQVCMDFCMADISGVCANVGDYVCVMGEGIPARELADEYGTIVYEVLTSVGERAERIYVCE